MKKGLLLIVFILMLTSMSTKSGAISPYIEKDWEACSTVKDCYGFVARCSVTWILVNKHYIKDAENSVSKFNQENPIFCRPTIYTPGPKPNIGCIEHQCKEINTEKRTPPVECCAGSNSCVPCPPGRHWINSKTL